MLHVIGHVHSGPLCCITVVDDVVEADELLVELDVDVEVLDVVAVEVVVALETDVDDKVDADVLDVVVRVSVVELVVLAVAEEVKDDAVVGVGVVAAVVVSGQHGG